VSVVFAGAYISHFGPGVQGRRGDSRKEFGRLGLTRVGRWLTTSGKHGARHGARAETDPPGAISPGSRRK